MPYKLLAAIVALVAGGTFLFQGFGAQAIVAATQPDWGPHCDDVLQAKPGLAFGIGSDGKGQLTGLESLTTEEWRAARLAELGCDPALAPAPQAGPDTAASGDAWDRAEAQWRAEDEAAVRDEWNPDYGDGWGE